MRTKRIHIHPFLLKIIHKEDEVIDDEIYPFVDANTPRKFSGADD